MAGKIKTAEEIAKATNDCNGRSNIIMINKLYRKQDESHKWPVNGHFNLTERAINRACEFRKTIPCYGLEYCYLLETIMSDIVNTEL